MCEACVKYQLSGLTRSAGAAMQSCWAGSGALQVVLPRYGFRDTNWLMVMPASSATDWQVVPSAMLTLLSQKPSRSATHTCTRTGGE